MPQVVPALAAAIGVSATAVNIGIAVGGFAVQYLLSASAKAKARREDGRQNRISGEFGISPRRVLLGLYRTEGITTFFESKDGVYYQQMVICDDIIDSIKAFYINDIKVNVKLVGSFYEVTSPPFNTTDGSLVRFEIRHGNADQAASNMLLSAFPSAVAVTDKAIGVAYVVAEVKSPKSAKSYQKIFGGAQPKFSFLVKGHRVYDPRDIAQSPRSVATWKHSTNPALLLLHYITHPKGCGASRAMLDATSWKRVANVADTTIMTKKGERANFEMGALISDDEDKREVVDRMLDTFGGRLYMTSRGRIGVTCDELEVERFTLTESMVEELSVKRMTPALYAATSVRCRYISEDHGYLDTAEEAAPWVDDQLVRRVGRDIPHVMDLPYVFRHDQCRRLMKRKLHELNDEWTVEGVGKWPCIEMLAEHRITVDLPMFNITGPMRMRSLSISQDAQAVGFAMASYDPEGIAWDYLTEEGDPPAIPPVTSESTAPSTPTNVAVIVGNNGGDIRAILTWSAPPSGKTVVADYKLASASTWTALTLVSPTTNGVTITGLTSGQPYNFRVRFDDSDLGSGDYATLNFTATAIAGSTGSLGAASASSGVMRINVGVTQAAAATAAYVEIAVVDAGAGVSWTSPTVLFLLAGAVASSSIAVGSAGTYDVYFRSRGANNDTGAVTGPISAAATSGVLNDGATSSTGLTGGASISDGNATDFFGNFAGEIAPSTDATGDGASGLYETPQGGLYESLDSLY